MKTKKNLLKLIFIVYVSFAFYNNVAGQKYNTIITLTTDNDSVKNVISMADTISVYYIHSDKGQTHTTAIKKGDNNFLLTIPKGIIIALKAGYQNCYDEVDCIEIKEGKKVNKIEIPIRAKNRLISEIRFYAPCVIDN